MTHAATLSKQQRQQKFLNEFSTRHLITEAAEAAGVHEITVHRWKREDEEFAQKFRELDEMVTTALEEKAWEVAVEDGNPTMLIFLLKARRPAMYRENRIELTGAGGGAIQFEQRKPEEDSENFRRASEVLDAYLMGAADARGEGAESRPSSESSPESVHP